MESGELDGQSRVTSYWVLKKIAISTFILQGAKGFIWNSVYWLNQTLRALQNKGWNCNFF
jgi:hypothetical protein